MKYISARVQGADYVMPGVFSRDECETIQVCS